MFTRRLSSAVSLSGIIGALVFSQSVLAADEDCIQSPSRIEVCPHIVYRSAVLPGKSSPEIVCLCMADFRPLLKPPADDKAALLRKMELKDIEIKTGLTEEALIKLIKG